MDFYIQSPQNKPFASIDRKSESDPNVILE